MTIGLYLQMNHVTSPSDFYRSNPPHKVKVAGEEITFVFAPQTVLNKYGDGTRWGFQDNGDIYISKNLHPVMVPFVVFYLHYQGLEKEALVERLGEVVQTLPPKEVDDLIFALTLDQAKSFLRPQEMAGLIERFKQGPTYEAIRHDLTISSVVGDYFKGKDSTSLVKREQGSIGHYEEQMRDYFRHHHTNKWIRKSRAYQSSDSWVRRKFENEVIRAEDTIAALVEEPQLKENIPDLMRFVEQLVNLEPGQAFEVEQRSLEHLFLYRCSKDYVRSPPIEFVRDQPGEPTAVIRVKPGSTAGSFFRSLQTRLGYLVSEEIERTDRLLENLSEIVSGVKAGEPEIYQLAYDYATQLGLVHEQDREEVGLVKNYNPLPILSDIQEKIVEHREGLALVVTSSPEDTQRILKAGRARKLLEDLGLPTDTVDQVVFTAMQQANLPLRKYAAGNQLPA